MSTPRPASSASQAGITIGQLNAALDSHGLAFENLGDIDKQSIAGATATGTHGTGSRLRNISSQLHAVELMRADGTVVTLERSVDPDGWRAARVSLGALGVVTAVTLKTVPAYRLHGVDGPAPLEQTLERLDQLPERARPLRDVLVPLQRHRAAAPQRPHRARAGCTRSRARAYLEDIVLVNHGLRRLLAARPPLSRA